MFRGYTFFGVRRIDFGGKRDWYLILKEEEEEFCKIDKVYKLNFILEKIDIRLFFLMEIVLKRNLK